MFTTMQNDRQRQPTWSQRFKGSTQIWARVVTASTTLRRGILVPTSSSSDTVALSSDATNNLFKRRFIGSRGFLGSYGQTVAPNGELQRVSNEQRYGIKVSYDGGNRHSPSSGTTGDTSQVDVNFSVLTFDATTGVPTGG